jgi:hypothetical protein
VGIHSGRADAFRLELKSLSSYWELLSISCDIGPIARLMCPGIEPAPFDLHCVVSRPLH